VLLVKKKKVMRSFVEKAASEMKSCRRLFYAWDSKCIDGKDFAKNVSLLKFSHYKCKLVL